MSQVSTREARQILDESAEIEAEKVLRKAEREARKLERERTKRHATLEKFVAPVLLGLTIIAGLVLLSLRSHTI